MRPVHLLFGVLVAMGCGSSREPTTPAAATSFFGVTMTPEAINIAVGETQQFTVVPQDVNGAPLSGLPAPVFETTDSTVVSVTSSGIATGVAPGAASIIGKVQSDNLTYADTTVITVSDFSEPLASFSLTFFDTPDPRTATIGSGDVVQLGFVALDSAGNTIDNLQPTFDVLDPTRVTAFTRTLTSGGGAYLYGYSLGATKIVASITSGGVTKVDTVSVQVINATDIQVNIQSPPGYTLAFDPPRVTISPGGSVKWCFAYLATGTFDITFDDPAAVTDGNVPAFTENDGCQTRVFPTAGTYNYKSTTNGLTGTVIVQ